MTIAFPEIWRPIASWSMYQVSDRGHVRRRPRGGRPTAKLLRLTVDTNGYENVTLTSGKRERTFRVDWLVCSAFHGNPPDRDMEVQHKDGVTWNDWNTNLRWGYRVMATQWYSGPVDAALRGYYRYGPYPSKTSILPYAKYGNVIVAFDDDGQIKAFEFVFSHDLANSTRNPYDLVRYWRATTKHKLMEVECREGMDVSMDPNRNPYEAAAQYRKMAEMHPDYAWALYLLEAAFYIERMADCVYKGLAPPEVQVVPAVRRPLEQPRAAPAVPAPAPSAPAPMARRPIHAQAAPAPVQAAPLGSAENPRPRPPGFVHAHAPTPSAKPSRRRPPPPGFFS